MAASEANIDDWSDADSGEDEDEEDMDMSEMEVVCLFCDAAFPNASLMFEHCKTAHHFDIVDFSRSCHLDFLRFAKFVNFCRKNKSIASDEPSSFHNERLVELNLRIDTLGDELLKPAVETDALLWFDIEAYLEDIKIQEPKTEKSVCMMQNGNLENHSEDSSSKAKLLSDLNKRSKESLIQELIDVREKLEQAQLMLVEAEHQINLSRELVSRLTTDEQESQAVRDENQEDQKKEPEDPDQSYFESYDSLNIHEEMLQDRVRTESYRNFVFDNKTLFEGKKVLDLGCGTGILSLFAASAGAQHVLAVDKSNIVKIARDNVQENGFNGRIEVEHGKIESFELSQKLSNIDVIISEWMGYFLLFECMLDSVIWARDHIKTKFGKNVHIYPRFYSMWLCALDDSELRENNVNFWSNVYGFKMSAVKKNIGQNAIIAEVKSNVVCSDNFRLRDIDAETVAIGYTNFASEFKMKASRKTTITAFCGYFDVNFSKDSNHNVIFSTGPHSTLTHWQQVVFVLQKPREVEEGSLLTGKIGFQRDPIDPRSLKITISTDSETCQYFLK